MRRTASLLALFLFLLVPASAAAAQQSSPWPRFRGPAGNATADHPGLPSVWSRTENVEWAAEVPGMGWSSPIVVGGRVCLTTAVSEQEMKPPQVGTTYSNDYVAELQAEGLPPEEVVRRVTERDNELPDEIVVAMQLRCYGLESGEMLWERTLHEGPPPAGRHRKNSFTSETPVTDGEHVYVYFTNLGVWAFDLDGEERWQTQLEPYPLYLDLGAGTSPVVHDGRLFVLHDNQQQQFVAAFDTNDGSELWRVRRDLRPDRPGPQMWTGWSTPFVWENELRSELITQGPETVVSYDPTTGAELWRMGGHSVLAAPSPFAYGDLLYVTSGVHGDDNRPIAAIRAGASGDITLPELQTSNEHVAWYDRVAGTYIPTPVAYDDAIWVVYDRSIMARYDAATGERTWRARLTGGAGHFTASPWAYDGKVFAIDEEGSTFVVAATGEFELLRVNRLDEMVLATPAIAGDRLLVRTRSRLYSIRDAAAASATAGVR